MKAQLGSFFLKYRPINSRHNESTLHRRSHALHDRSTKPTRTARTNRLVTTQQPTISQTTEDEKYAKDLVDGIVTFFFFNIKFNKQTTEKRSTSSFARWL